MLLFFCLIILLQLYIAIGILGKNVTAAAVRAQRVSLCVCVPRNCFPCAAAHKVSAELATIHGLWQIVLYGNRRAGLRGGSMSLHTLSLVACGPGKLCDGNAAGALAEQQQ